MTTYLHVFEQRHGPEETYVAAHEVKRNCARQTGAQTQHNKGRQSHGKIARWALPGRTQGTE